MVIVNGVRYRPEDAPKEETEAKQAEAPKNKARKPANKSAPTSDDKE